MFQVFAIAFPFFAIILAGFGAGRLGVIPKGDSVVLNRFVFTIAMPVALFSLTSQSAPIRLTELAYALVYLIAALITLLSAYWVGRRLFKLPRPDAGVHAFATTLGNAVFLGLPIAQSIEGWGHAYVILMLMEGIIIITIASILIAGRLDENKTDLRTSISDIAVRPLKNPLVMGALGGYVFSLTGIVFADPVVSTLSFLGRAAGPTALFSLGLFLAATPVDRHSIFTPAIAHITLSKFAILPGLVWTGLLMIGETDPKILGPVTLFTLLPSGVVVFISASHRGRYVEVAATAIGITTVISVLTITGVLFNYT